MSLNEAKNTKLDVVESHVMYHLGTVITFCLPKSADSWQSFLSGGVASITQLSEAEHFENLHYLLGNLISSAASNS